MTKVVIFDSGVGGLSIARELRSLLPNLDIKSISDPEFFPYGNKTGKSILNRVLSLIPNICETEKPDALVLACNTATTIALSEVRKKVSIPIVGVVPPIKPAAEKSRSKIIGILATEATISREYTERLINKYARNVKVIRIGSQRLVELAENYINYSYLDLKTLEDEVQGFLKIPDLDCVALACTHFSHFKKELAWISGPSIQWIDPSEAIARRVLKIFS